MFITTDKELITKILNHPKVYKWITDDCSPKVYEPVIHPSIIYLTDETQSAVVRIDPMNGICCTVHFALLPEAWGRGLEIVKEAIEWGFLNLRYVTIVAIVPMYNRLIIKIMRSCGFIKVGVLEKSFLKSWKLWDQEIWSLTKNEYKENIPCQQQ